MFRFDKMNQLRVAYMASKRKPSLIIMSSEDVLFQAISAEVTDNNQRPKESDLITFQMMLKTILDPAIQKYPPDQQAEEKLFRHIIQYHIRIVYKQECLSPQSYLDCGILYDQQNIMLKRSTEDITLGAIMVISCGNADRKRLARRKLNLVDTDINAWICLVNLTERIMLTE